MKYASKIPTTLSWGFALHLCQQFIIPNKLRKYCTAHTLHCEQQTFDHESPPTLRSDTAWNTIDPHALAAYPINRLFRSFVHSLVSAILPYIRQHDRFCEGVAGTCATRGTCRFGTHTAPAILLGYRLGSRLPRAGISSAAFARGLSLLVPAPVLRSIPDRRQMKTSFRLSS